MLLAVQGCLREGRAGYQGFARLSRVMIPISISVSDVTFVDFKNKKKIASQVLMFEKLELVREGLIDFNRLVGRGHPTLVSENFGQIIYYKAS
jgi:hypothetical protein